MNCRFYSYFLMLILYILSIDLHAENKDSLVHFGNGNGTIESPYSITTPQQLDAVRSYLGSRGKNVYFRLDTDIDMSAFNGGFWEPIGSKGKENAFQGKFDGNKKKIFNLKIGRQGYFYQYTGFFGCISDGAEIRNLYLESGEIIGNSTLRSGNVYTGSIVGYISSNEELCIIDSCVNKIQIMGGQSLSIGSTYTGGICGYAVAGVLGKGSISISSCINWADVTAKSGMNTNFTGGICGKALVSSLSTIDEGNSSSMNITFCVNIGKISGGSSYSSTSSTGGICGYYSVFSSGYPIYTGNSIANIASCINSGTILSGDEAGLSISYVGGISGYQSGNGNIYGSGYITSLNCINNGIIVGNDLNKGSCSGGIVGFSGGYSLLEGTVITKISESYNTALVISQSKGESIGGICGEIDISDISTAVFSHNYWLKDNINEHIDGGIGVKPTLLEIDDKDVKAFATSEFVDKVTFGEWNFGETYESPWKIWDGIAAPYLFIQSAPINIRQENENELNCSLLNGNVIDSIIVYKKYGWEYIPFKVLRETKDFEENNFVIDIKNVSEGDILQLISCEKNKMPSNPQNIQITNTTYVKSTITDKSTYIYPNPVLVGGDIYININGSNRSSANNLQLFTTKGEMVRSYHFDGGNTKFEAPNTTGIFILQIITENKEKKHYKLIVK